MRRARLEPGREVKLRGACDRCHDLKNRCVRTGGDESRCDRCERLDIDCVYRSPFSMGRPKRQKKTNGQATHTRTMSETTHDMASTDIGGSHEVDQCQIEVDANANGSITLTDMPWDNSSLVISPEVIWPGTSLTEQDWSTEFQYNTNDSVHDSLLQYQETHKSPHNVHEGHLPGHDKPKEAGASDCNSEEPAATLITRLFQLQGQLYLLLLSGEGNVGFRYVQEGLEASKSFLDVLQTSSASKSTSVVSSKVQHANPDQPTPPESNHDFTSTSENDPSKAHLRTAPMSYIVVQQTLTCYLYVLLLLDHVVEVLTRRAGMGGINVSVSQESSPTIHLGIFSLASQPALNNEIVLLLILRLVQHLQEIIQTLASRCHELIDSSDQLPIGGSSESESLGKTKEAPVSLAIVVHSMSNLVVKREKLLVSKLLSLTSVSGSR